MDTLTHTVTDTATPNTKQLVLLKAQDVTPKLIQQTRERFKLTWDELHCALGYTARGGTLYRAIREPEKYLTKKLKWNFVRALAKLERDHGFFHVVTFTADVRLPKRLRVAGAPKVCLGHREMTFELPTSGYCSAECRALHERRTQRQSKKNKKGGNE